MSKKNKNIEVKGISISVFQTKKDDYISLTDIAKSKDGDSRAADIIKNWIRNRGTIEFIGTWESLYNPDFKVVEFDHFRMSAGLTSFVLSPGKWIEKTNAIGIFVKGGRYGGTYAHKDIAFEFCSAISPTFKLFLIKEFQRLKDDEQKLLGWDIKRNLTKINYRIHTDAIKENIIPPELTKQQKQMIYASEGDVLNMAMFGMTAKEWRKQNPKTKGNIRDYSTIEQLLVLANLESMNSEFIRMRMSQQDRLVNLNRIAIQQMKSLTRNNQLNRLKENNK